VLCIATIVALPVINAIGDINLVSEEEWRSLGRDEVYSVHRDMLHHFQDLNVLRVNFAWVCGLLCLIGLSVNREPLPVKTVKL
jgi:hypothetical protein